MIPTIFYAAFIIYSTIAGFFYLINKDNRWTKKQHVIAFVLGGPYVWLGHPIVYIYRGFLRLWSWAGK